MSLWVALLAMFSSIRWTGTCSTANGANTAFGVELTEKTTQLDNLTLREMVVAFDPYFLNLS
jgi:hypothetical protein